MLTALAFAHFSSELLLKEQVIIPVKKTLNNAGHIDAKLIDFSEICQKHPAKSAVFYWLFLGEVSPKNFPWNRPIFLRICPKILRNLTFSAKMPRNRPIFLRILTFLQRKSREMGRVLSEFWLFSRENPAKSAHFSANLPLKMPRNFAFFSAKYQKPCVMDIPATARELAQLARLFLHCGIPLTALVQVSCITTLLQLVNWQLTRLFFYQVPMLWYSLSHSIHFRQQPFNFYTLEL